MEGTTPGFGAQRPDRRPLQGTADPGINLMITITDIVALPLLAVLARG